MNRLPDIGEGVLIPWGLDTVAGEVVDVVGTHHAVVAVPIGGDQEGEVETVRMNLNALMELPPWRVKSTKKAPSAPGSDAAGSWWIAAERGGQEAKVEVRVSNTLANSSSSHLPREVTEALNTDGRSAFAKFARRFRLPTVIVVSTHGVFELSS